MVSCRGHDRIPVRCEATRGVREPLMVETRLTRVLLRLGAGSDPRLHLPPARRDRHLRVQREHLPDLADRELHDEMVQRCLAQRGRSRRAAVRVKAALGATTIALVLGTLAAIAVLRARVLRTRDDLVSRHPPDRASGDHHRARAPGDDLRTSSSPSASASASGRSSSGMPRSASSSSTTTPSRGRAGSAARSRRPSMDLGADHRQTFRYVTFPQLRTALLAAALLAFALSFDEVVVTIFTLRVRSKRSRSGSTRTLASSRTTDRERRRALRDLRVDHPRLDRSAHRRRRAAVGPARQGDDSDGCRDAGLARTQRQARWGTRRRCRRDRSSRSGSSPGTAGGSPRRSRTGRPATISVVIVAVPGARQLLLVHVSRRVAPCRAAPRTSSRCPSGTACRRRCPAACPASGRGPPRTPAAASRRSLIFAGRRPTSTTSLCPVTPGAHLLVGRVRCVPTRVADRRGVDAMRSCQKMRSAPQKQPMPKTARSVPSGNGGPMGVPRTRCRPGT